MVRRGIRRGVRRSFRRLTRAAVLSMAVAAGGVTLATIAAKEGVSQEEAEEMMEDLVSEGVLKKEQRDGQTVYVPTGSTKPAPAPATAPQAETAQLTSSMKFCRQCGAKIPGDSKFCEKCGALL